MSATLQWSRTSAWPRFRAREGAAGHKRKVKVMTNSQMTGYKENPRATCGDGEKTGSRAAVEVPV